MAHCTACLAVPICCRFKKTYSTLYALCFGRYDALVTHMSMGSGCHHYLSHGVTLGVVQANILQPLTHVGTLNLRYEAVEELLGSEEMHLDVAQALQTLPRDLDKVCRGLVSTQSYNHNIPLICVCLHHGMLIESANC